MGGGENGLLDGNTEGTSLALVAPNLRSSSRFRLKALLERCWTVGKPVLADENGFGVGNDKGCFLSTIEPTKEGFCAMSAGRVVM